VKLGKVLVVGAAEAGKSTLIRALCPGALNLAVNGRTVAMDHATLSRDDMMLSLVGVPGQPRFQPVREALAVGARCAVWVHRAGAPSDPLTTSLVARLIDRQVPYLVYVNHHRASTTAGWPAPAGLAPPEAVLEGDLIDPDGSVGHLVEAVWRCVCRLGRQLKGE
jgi:signal recognition particle receptor subunit beta